MHRLDIEAIGKEVRDRLSRQSYASHSTITGLKLIDLRVHTDDQGAFLELLRLVEDGMIPMLPDFKVRQCNFCEVLPGAVKAWHLHFGQEDLWFVPQTERLLVGLYDVRKDSSSYGATARVTMGGGKAQLLYIPRGVAHGAANPWSTRSVMLYFVNQHFNPDDPDEYRIPWDSFGPDFWKITKG